MLQVFSFGCCKSRSGRCIYLHVASVCFKCFRCFIRLLQVFYLDVAYVCNGFQVFLQVFQMHVLNVSSVFFLYVAIATVAYGCFKSRSGVAHGMAWEAAGGADPLLGHSLASPTR